MNSLRLTIGWQRALECFWRRFCCITGDISIVCALCWCVEVWYIWSWLWIDQWRFFQQTFVFVFIFAFTFALVHQLVCRRTLNINSKFIRFHWTRLLFTKFELINLLFGFLWEIIFILFILARATIIAHFFLFKFYNSDGGTAAWNSSQNQHSFCV